MAVGESLPLPAKGWKRYGAYSGLIRYFGAWTREASSAYLLGARAASPRTALNSGYRFKFKGTKLRLLGGIYPEYTPQFSVAIDGVVYNASQQGPTRGNAVIFEIENLPNIMHTVEVTKVSSGTWSVDMILEAIDVGAEGRAFHVDEVESPLDLTIGKKIRAYTASYSEVPLINCLGLETADFMDPYYNSSSLRRGDFYFNMVDERNSGPVLIADRVLNYGATGAQLITRGLTVGVPTPVGELRGLLPTMYSADHSTGVEFKWSPNVSGSDFGWKACCSPQFESRPFWYANGAGDKYIEITLPKAEAVMAISMSSQAITGSIMGVKDYRLVGITEEGLEVHLVGASRPNTSETSFVKFSNTVPFKKYRVYVDRSWHAETTALLGSLQLYAVNEGDVLNEVTLTVPSGGHNNLSPTLDGMSEWDKYIVNNPKVAFDQTQDWNFTSATNWQWTRSIYYSTTALTVRGNSTGPATISYAGSGAIYGVRPLLRIAPLIRYPKVTIDRDYYLVARGNGANMLVTVLPDAEYPDIKWGVRVKVGSTQIYWSGEIVGASQLTVHIPPRLFTTSEELPVTVELISEGRVRNKVDAKAQIVNSTPEIYLEREGYKIMLDIVDTDGDPIYYEFKINGVDLVPPANALGQIRMDYYLRADQINIGSTNKITVKAIDLYGDSKEAELSFLGEYIGLVFSNEGGDIYSTDSGEILRRLVMPFVRAGDKTAAVPVVVTNKYPFNVRDLTLTIGYYEDLPDTRILIGKDPTNVNYEALTYDDMMSNGQFKTFYVMLHTEETAVGRGKFRIQANARKV